MSVSLAVLVVGLGLVTAPAPALANRRGSQVWAGADAYTPWANTPGTAGVSPERLPAADDLPDYVGVACHADAMGECLVPPCGDPLAAGSCEMPSAAITVDPAWSRTRLSRVHFPAAARRS
jgi:hypothetical protein